MKPNRIINIIVLFLTLFIFYAFNSVQGKVSNKNIKVTFIELGSVRCIPCQKMQRVIDSIKINYNDQVKIIFYDVWTKEGKPFGYQFKIRAIPTQVFLDKDGKEYYRHEGYFPFDQVKQILSKQGVK